jgi:hypothetical protein
MRVTYSYESILRVVGHVLAEADVHQIALRETEDGLVVEGRHADFTPYQHTFTLGELCALIERVEGHVEDLFNAVPAHSLHEFLARHEAVVAR